jgi:metal-sulfur cluster biosynthetic enzyme
MVTKAEILKVLKKCYDPEIPVNIVDLGLVYGISIKKGNVKIKLGLTSPYCPMGNMLAEEVKDKVKKIKGVKKVDVELVLEPKWTPERMEEKVRKKLGL